eukprot:CAMPEP_0173389290 /NCGR_PEP_ID=MMETSP1356-20130122/11408_1 /TAXON_ID=77927 ORGANISM="Hemiselmis virescens, Strain PCC157" /NCGR_SAMPLE_ID=MMETSP1356 /ASSEMBLY_ACC=CAM_ASM_000847 /LENGTH=31 /DNA_ID= /DNA_START= /DNA_END= /DNA_ORIENTATION=
MTERGFRVQGLGFGVLGADLGGVDGAVAGAG